MKDFVYSYTNVRMITSIINIIQLSASSSMLLDLTIVVALGYILEQNEVGNSFSPNCIVEEAVAWQGSQHIN